MPPVVMSFGAAAMHDGSTIVQAAEVLIQYQRQGDPVVAAVSALAGTTELLAESIQLSSYARVHNKLLSMHQNAARRLIRDQRDRALLIQDIGDILGTYNWMGRSLQNRPPTPAETATILAIGERLGARLLTSHLQHEGVRASALNASEILITDDKYLSAQPDLNATRSRLQTRLRPLLDDGYVVVMGRSTGGTLEGKPTRTGKIDAGALLAAGLDASSLLLWTDQDGIQTADPDLVPDARTILLLSLDEMDALAFFGVDVPPGSTLAPVIEADIPVHIRSIFEAQHAGTRISPTTQGNRALVIRDKLREIRVNTPGPDHDFAPGIAALDRRGIPALAGATGDHLCFYVDAPAVGSSRLTLEDVYGPCTTHPDRVALVIFVGKTTTAQVVAACSSAAIPLHNLPKIFRRDSQTHHVAAVVADDDLQNAAAVLHELVLA